MALTVQPAVTEDFAQCSNKQKWFLILFHHFAYEGENNGI